MRPRPTAREKLGPIVHDCEVLRRYDWQNRERHDLSPLIIFGKPVLTIPRDFDNGARLQQKC